MRLFLSAVGVSLCLASAASSAPVETYGRLPQIEEVAISPDGKLVSMIVTNGENRSVLIREAMTDKVVAVAGAGTTKLRAVQFADAGHLLITGSIFSTIQGWETSRSEKFLTTILDIASNKTSPLFKQADAENLKLTISTPQVREHDGKTMILFEGLQYVGGNGTRISLFRTEPNGLRSTIVETGADGTRAYLVDEAGAGFERTDYSSQSKRWGIAVKGAAGWRTIAEGHDDLGPPSVLGLARNPGALLVRMEEDDGPVIKELTMADGRWSAPLPYQETDRFFRDRLGHLVGTVSVEGDKQRYTFFDPADQANWNEIVKAFPDDEVSLVDWSQDRKTMVVAVESRTDGPGYAVVDLRTKKANWLGETYAAIGAAEISPVKPIAYKAKDGLDISGYLTLPKGKPAKGLPLVVLAHGGPAARDSLDYDWWSQALASQGYAVLQSNFRGSAGFGDKFMKAGYGEFGRKMQTDLSDGVRYLAAEGTIDPKRVCIVGASYGGYAALAGAAIDTGVYRCAVSVAGVADPSRMLRTERRDSGDATFRYWKQFMGVSGPDDRALAEISPVVHADQVAVPVLLIHGSDDSVVLPEQSQIMLEALKRADKSVEFVSLPNEDHWLSHGATRQQMLRATADFLKKNNPPD